MICLSAEHTLRFPIPDTVRSLPKLISFTIEMFQWREAVARLTRDVDRACLLVN